MIFYTALALSPDPQTIETPMAGTEKGKPAATAACLAGFWPWPPTSTWKYH